MRTTLASVSAMVLGLAMGVSASAQTDTDAGGRQGDRPSGDEQTIRGVISGISVTGEMSIDFRTNRAVALESDYLTVVGSPVGVPRSGEGRPAARGEAARDPGERPQADRGDAREADRDQDQDQAEPGRRRENVYVLAITSRTKVFDATRRARQSGDRDDRSPAANGERTREDPGAARERERERDDDDREAARDRDRNDEDRENRSAARDRDREDEDRAAARDRNPGQRPGMRGPRGTPSSFEALEVGDRVVATFVRRSDTSSAGRDGQAREDRDRQKPNEMNRRHGRERTYFGEAVSITILPSPAPRGGAAGAGQPSARDQDQDRDRQNETRDRAREDEARDRDRGNEARDRDRPDRERGRDQDNDQGRQR